MKGTMTVKCDHCDEVLLTEEVDLVLPPSFHTCPPPDPLLARFGALDVESLAIAIYNTFHGHDHDECAEGCKCCHDWDDEPWEAFEHVNDDVVNAFRHAAMEVADQFADGRIGGVYYGKR